MVTAVKQSVPFLQFCWLGKHYHCDLILMTCRSWSCHVHTISLAIGVLRQPVLDCETTFHSDYGGRDSPFLLLDDLSKLIFLATEAPSDSFE